MLPIGFGFNKSLFLAILVSDIILFIACYFMNLFCTLYFFLIVVVMLIFKYFHYKMSYKVINRRLILYAGVSVIMSILLEAYILLITAKCLLCMAYIRALAGLLCGAIAPVTVTCKVTMIVNLYFTNKLVPFGMTVSVSSLDGGFMNKIDSMAEYLPL